ncbi:alcohol dehydrogenase [Anaerosporomusa subterranea]|jgi:threonine dehydrogenase-like Zn-dependent dehydrogenase|uniref:Alcohol dehydrogenase n=1 Tax=Anaerosporomusa subterranea TaxID=1794912 RepID=A0A154BSQ4_ANASB|nr:zinc-binding dehydrogenase [Anaerosporomusa subterranea]KYZ76961.1 alcohol dehydrogenase [Anaerosporomusa subterranea]
MKSRAMVLEAFNQPLVMREFDIQPLAEGELLVKIEAAGVCGSDVHMQKGEDPRTPLPIILGHEGVGRIVAMNGARKTVNGETLAEGDLILWTRGMACNHCYACAVLLEPWLCQDRKTYGINRTSSQPPYLNGCYSEYVTLLNSVDIYKAAADIDPAVLVSASCSGATIAHAFDHHAPKLGDTVLVQGPGPLGLYAIMYAKKLGASRVIVIGGSGNRLEICRDFGADVILNRNTTSVEERRQAILDLTYGRGVDMAIEAVGHPSAVQEGLKLVRSGGAYLSVGFSQPPGECQVDFFKEVVSKNLKIQGVWVSSNRHTQHALSMVQSQPELFAKMITHRFPLAEANAALQSMAQRDALKAVLIP